VRWKNGGNATVPLARLDVFPQGVRIGGSWGPLRRFVPCWEYLTSEVDQLQMAKSSYPPPLGGPGLRFRFNDGKEITFWTTNLQRTVAALEAVGFHVDKTVFKVPLTW
jgi:hypothetical protein